MTSDQALLTAKIEFGSGALTYEVGGVGQPLLVIHDFNQGDARGIAVSLSGCCKVLFPSLPGFGDSITMAGEHNNNKMAWAMLKFVDSLELEQFNILGLGLGSAVASEMIRRRPSAVNKLILVKPFVEVKLSDTLPGVMWVKHFKGDATFDPRAGREWLLDSARYGLKKALGDRMDAALVIPEPTEDLEKLVCEFINE